MKKLWSLGEEKWWIWGILLIVLLVFMTVGSRISYAYNQHNTTKDNHLKAHRVTAEIIENGEATNNGQWHNVEFGQTVNKRIQFRNSGETPVFLRVSFGETWVSGNGEWLANDDRYVDLAWTNAWDDEWQFNEDGWYYYKKLLMSDATTNEVLTAVTLPVTSNMVAKYQDASYQLCFTIEVMQYSDETVVNDLALKQTFNRVATVIGDVISWS